VVVVCDLLCIPQYEAQPVGPSISKPRGGSARHLAAFGGRPVKLQGGNLRYKLPDHLRGREAVFDWFEVDSDDTIRRCPMD
jgi:hypothetical protein